MDALGGVRARLLAADADTAASPGPGPGLGADGSSADDGDGGNAGADEGDGLVGGVGVLSPSAAPLWVELGAWTETAAALCTQSMRLVAMPPPGGAGAASASLRAGSAGEGTALAHSHDAPQHHHSLSPADHHHHHAHPPAAHDAPGAVPALLACVAAAAAAPAPAALTSFTLPAALADVLDVCIRSPSPRRGDAFTEAIEAVGDELTDASPWGALQIENHLLPSSGDAAVVMVAGKVLRNATWAARRLHYTHRRTSTGTALRALVAGNSGGGGGGAAAGATAHTMHQLLVTGLGHAPVPGQNTSIPGAGNTYTFPLAAVAGFMDLSHVPGCGGCNYTVVYELAPAPGTTDNTPQTEVLSPTLPTHVVFYLSPSPSCVHASRYRGMRQVTVRLVTHGPPALYQPVVAAGIRSGVLAQAQAWRHRAVARLARAPGNADGGEAGVASAHTFDGGALPGRSEGFAHIADFTATNDAEQPSFSTPLGDDPLAPADATLTQVIAYLGPYLIPI